MKKLLLFSILFLLGHTGYSQCAASFTYTSSPSGTTYNFTDLSSGNMTLYNWNFGDGNSSWLQNPTHTFASSGTYSVCLYVEDTVVGCSDTVCVPITVVDTIVGTSCDANYSYTQNGNDIDFNNLSNGSNLSYYWNFGDGSNSTASNPSHTYTNNGTYTVCLEIWSNDTLNVCSDSICNTITIFDSIASPCDANFSVSTSNSDANFYSSSAGTGLYHTWDFGDGTTSTLENPNHVYSNNGNYTVCLTVTSNDSLNLCADSVCQNISIMDTNLIICDASFITWANGNTTNFVNTSSGSNLSYYWDFGDGNSSSSSDVSHTYTSPGTYLACLTIWSNDSLNNCSDTTCQYITIIDSLNPCQAIFVLSQNGNTIDCSNSSTGNNLSYYWNFGDGNNSTIANPSHTYSSIGTYTVCLEIWSNDSINYCSDSLCMPVTILDTIANTTDLSLNNVDIYPNPAHDYMNVLIDGGLKNGQIRLIDLTGREMKMIAIETELTKIGLFDIPNGMYLIQLYDENNQLQVTKKFSKK